VKKNILNFILALIVLVVVFFIFIPYFMTNFSDIRQKAEKETNEQKILKEQLAQEKAIENAERKIYLTGKFDPAQKKDFVLIPEELNISGYKMYLRKETLNAFLKMRNIAKQDGIDLKIASATRNFDYQKNLWNNKWTGYTLVDGQDLSKSILDESERFKKILEYSAVPGTSRHHWGTDIDLNNANPEYFDTSEGERVYYWLARNASSFGFCQTYALKSSIQATGYKEEKWHWSYLPLAKVFTQEYKNLITAENLKGFDGDVYVPEFDLINDYVLSINPDCL